MRVGSAEGLRFPWEGTRSGGRTFAILVVGESSGGYAAVGATRV